MVGETFEKHLFHSVLFPFKLPVTWALSGVFSGKIPIVLRNFLFRSIRCCRRSSGDFRALANRFALFWSSQLLSVMRVFQSVCFWFPFSTWRFKGFSFCPIAWPEQKQSIINANSLKFMCGRWLLKTEEGSRLQVVFRMPHLSVLFFYSQFINSI